MSRLKRMKQYTVCLALEIMYLAQKQAEQARFVCGFYALLRSLKITEAMQFFGTDTVQCTVYIRVD